MSFLALLTITSEVPVSSIEAYGDESNYSPPLSQDILENTNYEKARGGFCLCPCFSHKSIISGVVMSH